MRGSDGGEVSVECVLFERGEGGRSRGVRGEE